MRALPILLMFVLAVFVGPLIVLASADAPKDAPLLVISGWGDTAEARIAAAGGEVVGPIRAPLGLFATSRDPKFPDALRAAGAWAVIDGGRIAALCGETL